MPSSYTIIVDLIQEVIFTGIFSKKKEIASESNNSDELLKLFAEITPSDIDKLMDIAKGVRDKTEYGEDTTKYLSLVKAIFGTSEYLSLGDTMQDRQKRYEIYDEMDVSTAYISSALDILSDDATQPDEQGVIIHIESDSPKVKNIVEDLFTRLEIEDKVSKWARATAKYGDFFVRVHPSKEQDGKRHIESVNDSIYPSSLERKELEGKLLAFTDATGGYTLTDDIYAPWEFIHFRHKGDIYRTQNATKAMNLAQGHNTYSLTSAYGQSILRPAIKVYAQLRFVENLIILSRLTNSIRRNIFLINTGEVEPNKAFETIKNYADLLKKDVSLDIENGIYNSQKHTVTYDEDIFIPVSDTKNDVRIESVGGDVNIGEQYDLEYLLNKLFAALKIPKAYLNYEQDLNARSTLIQLDIRYARSVGQLQNTIVSGLMRLACIELAYMGLDPDSVDLDIKLTTVSSIDEEAKLEQKKVSIESAKVMWDMLITMNDKLASLEQPQMPAGNPEESPSGGFDSLFSSNQVRESETPAAKSKSPLDLDYVTEHILTNYFKLDPTDVNKILRKEVPSKEESTNNELSIKRRRKNYTDIQQMYPNSQNDTEFSKIRESLTTKSKEDQN